MGQRKIKKPILGPCDHKILSDATEGGFRPLSAEPFYGACDDGEAGHTWKFDDANFNLTPHSYTYVWDKRVIRWDSGPPEHPLHTKSAHVDR